MRSRPRPPPAGSAIPIRPTSCTMRSSYLGHRACDHLPLGRLITITLLLLPLFWGGAQEAEEGIPWRADFRLSWSDFKGDVPHNAVPAATTASGISYSYSANLLHHEVI